MRQVACFEKRREYVPVGSTPPSLPARLSNQTTCLFNQSFTWLNDVVLANYQAPPGLRDLAQDNALVEALKISPEEWWALASLKPPRPLSKEGYLQVLFAFRAGERKNRISAG